MFCVWWKQAIEKGKNPASLLVRPQRTHWTGNWCFAQALQNVEYSRIHCTVNSLCLLHASSNENILLLSMWLVSCAFQELSSFNSTTQVLLGIQVSNKIQIQGKLGLIEPGVHRFACYLNSFSIPGDCSLQTNLKNYRAMLFFTIHLQSVNS